MNPKGLVGIALGGTIGEMGFGPVGTPVAGDPTFVVGAALEAYTVAGWLTLPSLVLGTGHPNAFGGIDEHII